MPLFFQLYIREEDKQTNKQIKHQTQNHIKLKVTTTTKKQTSQPTKHTPIWYLSHNCMSRFKDLFCISLWFIQQDREHAADIRFCNVYIVHASTGLGTIELKKGLQEMQARTVRSVRA